MVEEATCSALLRHGQALTEYLDAPLRRELEQLVAEAAAVSNWQDGGRWLRERGFSRLLAQGPISKVLRAFAYTLERLAEHPLPADLRITALRLSDCASDCSRFTGVVEVTAEKAGNRHSLLSGRFVWDCAVWGMPQAVAAQERGYACMTHFPDFARPAPA